MIPTEKVKHALRATVSKGLETLSNGQYKAKLPQLEAEYVTTLDCGLSEARETIRSMGYEYQAFAARKLHHATDKRDNGSYAKIDPEDRKMQFHVHLFETENGIEVYSHHEYRVIYPRKHYDAKDYTKGKACSEISLM